MHSDNAESLAELGFNALEIFIHEKKFLLSIDVPLQKVVERSRTLVEPCPRATISPRLSSYIRRPSESHFGCEEQDDNNVRLTIKANRNCL